MHSRPRCLPSSTKPWTGRGNSPSREGVGRGRDSRIYAEPCPQRIEHRHELRNWSAVTRGALRDSAVSLLSPTQDHINDLRPPGERCWPTVTSHAPGALLVTPGR